MNAQPRPLRDLRRAGAHGLPRISSVERPGGPGIGRLTTRLLRAVALVSLCVAGGMACATTEPGVVHVVRSGENLFRIARHYGISVSDLVDANDIPDVTDIKIGHRLWVPGARTRRLPVEPLRPPFQARATAESDALLHGGLQFAWPVRGRMSSRFGWRGKRPHEGLDIAAKSGTLVRAAEAGRVVFSGRMGGYGRVVIVRHNDAYATVYAHHRKNRVSKGGFVDKGSVVGEVGSSGRSSGPHLHFELRRDEVAQDPLLFLP